MVAKEGSEKFPGGTRSWNRHQGAGDAASAKPPWFVFETGLWGRAITAGQVGWGGQKLVELQSFGEQG